MIVLMIACDGCGLEEQTTTQHDAGVNEIDGVGWLAPRLLRGLLPRVREEGGAPMRTYLDKFSSSVYRKEDKLERLEHRLKRLQARGRDSLRLRQRIRRLERKVSTERHILDTWHEDRWP